MSLPHALLTALLEKPSSGSDLAQRFDRSLGHFWHATHQQIYRELARMEQAGWVESLPVESGRGRKRAYRILPEGHAELTRWVGARAEPQSLRDEMMVRLRAEAALGSHGLGDHQHSTEGLVDELQRRLQLHQEKLALYHQFEARGFNHPENPRPAREQALKQLVLQAGIQYEESWVYWCEQALAIIEMPDPA